MSRGRPRSFDRDIALHAIMEVFWARGYEGAQLVDLTKAIGIAPPSFYAAFGSKEAAFIEVVKLYIETVGAVPMNALNNSTTLREGVQAMLLASIDVALSQTPGGCLLILGVVNCLPENEAARNCLKEARQVTRDLIVKRLRRANAENELPKKANISQIAAFIHGVMQMISFQARDGASRTEIEALINPVLKALD
ncbi:TetR/AcrR family transcriptional regulator [Microvirga sp. W0021]|uniref:TetR/AcrR family transcriptional regulator n=1 Tax=Hohaiivirga grylli TaxID=3133970 RepID=A0ABV0BIS7_9HYPH